MSGTFTPGGAFTLNGVITRTVSGPLGIDVRVWGNVALSGTMVDTAPTCSATGPGTFACDPGATPAGNCQASTLHRFVFQCDGLSRQDQAIDLLATAYGNYTCSNRFTEQCIDDGSFDSYYLSGATTRVRREASVAGRGRCFGICQFPRGMRVAHHFRSPLAHKKDRTEALPSDH